MVAVSDLSRSRNRLIAGKGRTYRNRLIALYLTILLSVSLQMIFVLGDPESRFWPGWLVAVLPENLEGREVSGFLESRGFDGILSRETAEVSYMDIPDLKSIPLAELDEVLLPGDPRRDEFLSGAERLFHSADGREILYLPGQHSRRYRAELRDLPGAGNIIWADRRNSGAAGKILLYIAALSGLLMFNLKRWNALLPAGLLWLPALWVSPAAVSVFALFCALITAGIQHRESRRQNLVAGTYSLSVLIAGFLLILRIPDIDHLLIAISLATSTLTILLNPAAGRSGDETPDSPAAEPRSPLSRPPKKTSSPRAERKRSLGIRLKRRDHNLFEPVSLMEPFNRRTNTVPARRRSAEMLPLIVSRAAALALIVLYAHLLPANPGGLSIPIPGETIAGVDRISSYHELDTRRNGRSLPDLALMLASAAYQQGFMYGADFGLPVPGEKLSYSTYREEGGRLTEDSVIVHVYDRNWYTENLERISSTSMGKLLSSVGGAAPVALGGTEADSTIPTGYAVALLVAALISVLIPSRRKLDSRGVPVPLYSVRRRAKAA